MSHKPNLVWIHYLLHLIKYLVSGFLASYFFVVISFPIMLALAFMDKAPWEFGLSIIQIVIFFLLYVVTTYLFMLLPDIVLLKMWHIQPQKPLRFLAIFLLICFLYILNYSPEPAMQFSEDVQLEESVNLSE